MSWSHKKLQYILGAKPIAVNNFSQSTQSQRGPKYRSLVPPTGSLLRRLQDKVDEILAERKRGIDATTPVFYDRPMIEAPSTHSSPNVMGLFMCPPDTYGLCACLTISDMATLAFVSASIWAGTPENWRRLLALRRVVVKFVWSRAFDVLIRRVSPRPSQKLSIVQAVYMYFETTDRATVPAFAHKLPVDDPHNELICPLGELRNTFRLVLLGLQGLN